MFTSNNHIINNSATVNYSYSPDNLNTKNNSTNTNNTELIVYKPYKFYDFCLSDCVDINKISGCMENIKNITCNARICEYYLKCCGETKEICVKILLYQNIYYTIGCSTNVRCYKSVKYLDYQIPYDSYCIDYINVEASCLHNYDLCTSNNDYNIIIRFIIM